MQYNQPTRLQFLANAVMEICWLFAWAHLIMMLISDHTFPYGMSIGVFSSAAILTYMTDAKALRRVYKLLLHACALACAAILLVYAFIYSSMPFFNWGWLTELFSLPETVQSWIILILVLIWVPIFWVCGVKLARRSVTYWTVCRRFDFGILMFIGLLFFKIGLIRNNFLVEDQMTGWLIMTFLIFGLTAIGLARNRRQAMTTYLHGRRVIGVVLSFVFLVLFMVVGAASLLWPLFISAADAGYGLLQKGMEPVMSLLVRVLIFFSRNSLDRSMEAPKDGSSESFQESVKAGEVMHPAQGVGETDLLTNILWLVFGGLIVLSAIGLITFALWRLVKWLLASSPADKEKSSPITSVVMWVLALPGLLIFCWEWMCVRLRKRRNAVQIYTALVRWGKHSGITHWLYETPQEYGLRLRNVFPDLQPQISLITDLYQKAVYAEQALDEEQFKQANHAMRQLRSPRYWLSRLYLRLRCTGT